MKLISSILFIGSGLCGHAFAFSPEFHIGAESFFSRNVVNPAIFPLVKTGVDASSENYKIDLELKLSVEHPKANALSSKNFYYEISDDSQNKTESLAPFHFAFGRKWINWSQLDENWVLGSTNPIDSWDRLRSFSQGLTGIFMSAESKSLHLDLFASYIALPEITPNVVIEDHDFKFYHPQSVSAGPQTFDLLNRPTPLGYNLLIPSLSSIVFRPSVLFSIETAKNIDPFFAKVSYGHLPLNYFPVALQASLAIPIDQIVVDLRPRILAHNVYNAELAYHWNQDTQGGFSILSDQIISEGALPDDYTTATLGTTNYFSPWFNYENYKLAYIYSAGGIGSDTGPYANSTHNLFSTRVLYRNAVQFQTKFNEINLKYLHEFSIKANWIAVDWNHPCTKQLQITIGGDLISAVKDAADNGGAEFLSDLRAVDRIRLGVNYVF